MYYSSMMETDNISANAEESYNDVLSLILYIICLGLCCDIAGVSELQVKIVTIRGNSFTSVVTNVYNYI